MGEQDFKIWQEPACGLLFLIVLCLFLNGCPNPDINILFRTESGRLKDQFTIRSSDKLTTIRFSGLGLFGSTHNEDYSLRFGFRIDQDDTTQDISVDLSRITVLFEDSAMKKRHIGERDVSKKKGKRRMVYSISLLVRPDIAGLRQNSDGSYPEANLCIVLNGAIVIDGKVFPLDTLYAIDKKSAMQLKTW